MDKKEGKRQEMGEVTRTGSRFKTRAVNHGFTISHPRVGDPGQSFHLGVTSVIDNGRITERTSQVILKRK